MLYRIKMRLAGLLLPALVLLSLTGCSAKKQVETPPVPEVSAAQEPEEFPAEPETMPGTEASDPPEEAAPIRISKPEDIQEALYDALCAVRQPAPMDVSGVTLSENPEIDVKNLYYSLMAAYPELKYAYDISAAMEDGCLTCQIYYMPYKTGSWTDDGNALAVSTLGGLLRAAEEHIGTEPLPIRLTDPGLLPDDMSRVLQQAGGGYILCALNRDATEITYTPAMGLDMEECLSLLEQADRLAEQVIAQEVNESMTEREKAEALYTYLTGNVKYDRRYYYDLENMPYDSRTAVGALRDNTAICGGYSNALKLLFEKVGIPCYNVTGSYYRENHMWNIARLDGEWLWFDATSDRGISAEFDLRHFAQEELDATQYVWEPDRVELLLQMADTQP